MHLNSSLFSSVAPLQSGIQPALINFPIEKQLMSNWCWAAVTASVCRFYNGPPINQKQIVAKVKAKPICATSPLIQFCNDTANIDDALQSVGHLAQPFNQALSVQHTINELAGGKPISCQLYLPSLGGGHAVIIYGAFADTSNKLMLRVADPADGMLLVMPYQQLLNNYRNVQGQWIRSYTTH